MAIHKPCGDRFKHADTRFSSYVPSVFPSVYISPTLMLDIHYMDTGSDISCISESIKEDGDLRINGAHMVFGNLW